MKNISGNREKQLSDGMVRRRTIFSFSILFAGIAFAFFGWKWMAQQPKENGQPTPFRTILKANEKINSAIYSNVNLAKEYPKSAAAKNVRVNGDIGMGEDFNPEKWQLNIRENEGDNMLLLDISAIRSLPKRDIIFDFKCIEGWSQVTHWGGLLFSDFLEKYCLGTHSGKAPDPNDPEDMYKYVGLMTPDKKYYVGIDMKSMMHPQTILCYEMNEKALPIEQGYPLRLIITVKYGIKSLKRIGYLYFSDTPPPDYWHEQGYDYDSAL